jgi:tetratricopeptide (TPR) repeat protein
MQQHASMSGGSLLRNLALAFALAITAVPALAQQADVARAKLLVDQGKAAEAYEILAPLEDKLSGDVNYDYLLGVAALDSGKPDRATLAFERVLAVNPNFAGARLDMARAYFSLGDAERAKTEFLAVQAQNPPEQARAVIAQYLTAIEKIEQAKKRTLRAYVEASIGYDSNVNNSTAQSQIAVPALGGLVFTLNPTNIKRSDTFKTIGAGADASYQFRPEFGIFGGADFRQRDNTTQDTFDSGSWDMRAGAAFGESSNQLRLTGQGGRYTLDNNMSRKSEGASAEWRYTINPANQLNAFSQHSRNRFTDSGSQVNSFDQTTSGIGYLRVIFDGKAAIFGNYLFGKERDTEGRADGAKVFEGFKLGGQWSVREDIDLFAVASNQRGHYGRLNAAFLAFRRDDQNDLIVGANWRFAKDWTFKPQWVHSRNKSSIDLYSYERDEVSFTVRRDFAL